MKIGFNCSSFDLLHAGHVTMLKIEKQLCDYLIVGLQVDPTVDRPGIKNKPVQSVYERYVQLQACKYVDEILVWLRTTIIYNNFNNQLYTRKKRISREVRKNIIVKDCKAYPKPLISRKGIARIVRYKSATSATNLIKKAANLNLLTDKVVIKKVREISFGEFMFLKNKSGLSARFFFKDGYLCERKCNKIRFVEDKYLLAIWTIS